MKERVNRTDDREVSHPNLLGEAFLDQRHAGEPVPVTGELLLDRLQEDPWGKNKQGTSLRHPGLTYMFWTQKQRSESIITSGNDAWTHNIVDDLQVPREQVLQQRNGPLFESFGKDSVVGEEECVDDDLPGIVPWNLLLVDENAHEFRNGEGRVSIVELDGSI